MKSLSACWFASLLGLLFLAWYSPAAAQAPAWQSAQAVAMATTATTSSYSNVIATAVDAVGNVYVAGEFTNTVALGSTTLTSLGSNDVFVAKFSPVSNQFVWAQRAGGTNRNTVTALAVSGTSIYVAGYFYGPTAGFGPATLTNTGPANTSDLFVAKLTDAGSFVWARGAGGLGPDGAQALAVSGTSVYVAGSFFGPTASFGATTLTAAGSADVFVAKLTDTGSAASFVWAQQAGGLEGEGATGLAVSGPSVYVAGYFSSPTVSFGAVTLTNARPVNTNTTDVFVAKLTDAGSFVWAQRAGGDDSDAAHALVVNGTSVYVAGFFSSGTAIFGPVTLTNSGGISSGDVFVAKLTDAGSTGSFVWAQRAGGTNSDYAWALAVSGTSVYVAGKFAGSAASFGASTLTTGSFSNEDVFVAKLTDVGSAGSFAWAQQAGGPGFEVARALAISAPSVYVAGIFTGTTISFGAIPLSNSTTSALGFLASLTDATLTATASGQSRTLAVLYPSPAHHTVTLRRPAGSVPAPLTLCNVLGRPVRRYPAPSAVETVLDLHGLPAGLYLLHGAGPAQRLLVE